MTKEKTPNYTAAQETVIATFVGTGEDGKLTFADATTIAALPSMADSDGNARKPRSIAAKISRMGLPYAVKTPERKDGSKVETKAAIVAEIAKLVNVNLDGMDKSPRPALVALRDAVASLAA